MEKETLGILIAEDVLKQMFEGNNSKKAKELMIMMKQMKDDGKELIVKTPMSHFLRAVFLTDPNTPIKNIQKVLSFTTIIPSFANFKDQKACVDELLMIAKIMSKDK